MWLFLEDSFLSFSALKDDPNGEYLRVSSVRRGDIERIFPDCSPAFRTDSKFPFEAVVQRTEVEKALANRISSLSSLNLGESVVDDDYHEAICLVEKTMAQYQRVSRTRKTRVRNSSLPDTIETLNLPPEQEAFLHKGSLGVRTK